MPETPPETFATGNYFTILRKVLSADEEMFSGSVENTAVVNLSEHSRSAHDESSHSAHEDVENVNCQVPTLASERNSR